MTKLAASGLVLVGLLVLVGCSGGVTQQEYDKVKATATALEGNQSALQQELDAARAQVKASEAKGADTNAKVEQARKLVEVMDSLFVDVLFPQWQQPASPQQGSGPQGTPSSDLIDTLAREVAAQNDPSLLAKLYALLQAGQPSEAQLREFQNMVMATNNSKLIGAWQRIMAVTGGQQGPGEDPFRGLEEVVQATGDPTTEGLWSQVRRADQSQGMMVTRLAEIVERVRKLENPELNKRLEDALQAPYGSGPVTVGGLVRFGAAVRAVDDPALTGMAQKVFAGGEGQKPLTELFSYLMDKLKASIQ
ncbi:MAG: hypothetical protein Q8O76_08280, partial [Chloroflexota bacterium]|nr:hypothetical protein [Chloroflexota bacterium]